MKIKEIIEKSKLKEDIDKETLQNCIIALNDLVYVLKTEPQMKIIYHGMPDEVKNKLLLNLKNFVSKCYDNDPVGYSGNHINPEYWKKTYKMGDKLIDRFLKKDEISK